MKKHLCISIALIAASSIAGADTIYTNEASWDAAVSGITTVNFEGIVSSTATPPDPSGYQSYPGSTTIDGVTFADGPASPSGAALFVIGDDYYGSGVATISAQSASGTMDLEISLPSSVTSVGFDYIFNPGTLTVTLSDGTTETINAPDNPTDGFFGITDLAGITSLDITQPYSLADESINLSDFSYATANPVATPEPRSSILLAGLLLAFGLVTYRRRQSRMVG